MTQTLLGAIAATRFGLGARPGEIERAAYDPEGWLLAQIDATPAAVDASSAAERLVAARAADVVDHGTGAAGAFRTALANADLLARARLGAQTDAPFRERWTLFWLNHFALQVNGRTEMLAGAYAREALEPHVFGRFDDLLVSNLKAPGHVDFPRPVRVGGSEQRRRTRVWARAQREPRARGAGAAHRRYGGYAQADVVELSKALAGWTFGDPGGDPALAGRFVNDPARREPGFRRLLGRSYDGEGAAESMLRDLARRPQTRARIAGKVARHFVADAPSPALVGRLESALVRSDGSLDALARALVAAPEAWAPGRAKFKTPYEFVVSAHRALNAAPDDAGWLADHCAAVGHWPLWSFTAKGASDRAEAWATPLGLTRRVDLARALSRRVGGAEPERVAAQALGPLGGETVTRVLKGGHEPKDAVALVLLSPEFQYR